MASIEPTIRKITEEYISKLNPEQTSKLSKIFDKAKNMGFLTKQGGNGVNRTDDTMFIKSSNGEIIPVIIEYKGTKGKTVCFSNKYLHKIKLIKNGKYDVGPDSSISTYAINGACYYASIVLQCTKSYKHILAIGINGWNVPNSKSPHYEAICYIVTKSHPNKPKPFNDNYAIISNTQLVHLLVKNPEHTANIVSIPKKDRLKKRYISTQQSSKDLKKYLQDLNQTMYHKFHIDPSHRIALIVSCLLAAMGKDGQDLIELSYKFFNDSLKSAVTKVLKQKFPKTGHGSKSTTYDHQTKLDLLNAFLAPVFENQKYHERIAETNQTIAQYVYDIVFHHIYPLYRDSEEHGKTYFANILYNVMTSWLSSEQLAQENKDDVVLTPSYVADLMANIAQVKETSHVWDWALGSGGLLIAAMNKMIKDAKETYKNDPDDLKTAINNIRNNRLLGIERLKDIYVLALVNMILAQDGKSEILNESSIGNKNKDFNQDTLANEFKATRLLLNPPYDNPHSGHGMIFAEEAMSHMKSGYASVIIMKSAGSGQATEFNKQILKKNALIASIKMPLKLFKGTSTDIYLFQIGAKQGNVLFVDFSNDGYTRSHRKNSTKNTVSRVCSDGNTLANHRYHDLEVLVKKFIEYGCHDPEAEINKGYFKNQAHYTVRSIVTDPSNSKMGNDWNFDDHVQNNLKVTNNDINNAVKQYLYYEIGTWL